MFFDQGGDRGFPDDCGEGLVRAAVFSLAQREPEMLKLKMRKDREKFMRNIYKSSSSKAREARGRFELFCGLSCPLSFELCGPL